MRVGRKDIPEIKAIVLFSLWNFFYLLIPFGIIRSVTGRNLTLSKGVIITVFIVIAISNLYLLMNNNRYLKIYREFEKQPKLKSKYGLVTMLAYFLIPILAAVVFTNINRVIF
jgi:hypothetical protein